MAILGRDTLPMRKPVPFCVRLRGTLNSEPPEGSPLAAYDQHGELTGTYNRQAVCDKIGKSLRAMTGWLNGSNEPLASTVAALCQVLGVSADWLLGLSADPRRRAA